MGSHWRRKAKKKIRCWAVKTATASQRITLDFPVAHQELLGLGFWMWRDVVQIVKSLRINNKIDSRVKKIALNRTRVYSGRSFL